MTPITLQDIFNAAWQKFIVEKAPPAVDGANCKYLTKDGRKCAVGLCIPDGHPAQTCNGYLHGLVKMWPNLWADSVIKLNEERLDEFQRGLHDDIQTDKRWIYTPEEMEKKYREIAKNFNLTIPSPVGSSEYQIQEICLLERG